MKIIETSCDICGSQTKELVSRGPLALINGHQFDAVVITLIEPHVGATDFHLCSLRCVGSWLNNALDRQHMKNKAIHNAPRPTEG